MSVPDSVDAVLRMDMVPRVLETVCRITGMRFAAIARVTDDRWTACAVLDKLDFGLMPGSELALDSTICDEIRMHHQPVIFGHASRHPVFSTHHTPRIYGLESYVSVPIITGEGDFFGTLCAIDSEPRDFDEGTVVDTLSLFASLIASHLTMEGHAAEAEKALQRELQAGVLREQFLAVVGHDLRSPLQGARLIADQLGDMQQSERGLRLVRHLSQSITRMAGLIDDVMDFARGRLSGGIPVAPVQHGDLDVIIQAAADEVREGQPHCNIMLTTTAHRPVLFDGKRLRQLLANLLNNAVAHGDPTEPIHIVTEALDGHVEIRVSNQGTPIPASVLPRLFEPFVRAQSDIARPGLGLGLYIASEIARGHGGTLTVTSSKDAGTTFVTRLPLVR